MHGDECLCVECARELREELTKLQIAFEELQRAYLRQSPGVNANGPGSEAPS